ncbi:MAG: GNAT family N-acetyltransferase [Ignavibacteriales bacterium]
MTIERLKYDDLKLYKELIDECFDGSNDIEQYMSNYSENGNYEVVVAKEDNKIVGSATFYKIDLFTFSFQPALEIFNVAVLKEYRGREIAQKLFQFIIDYAKDYGYKSIYLTCLDSAYAAHHLYEKMGFVKMNSVKYNLYL